MACSCKSKKKKIGAAKNGYKMAGIDAILNAANFESLGGAGLGLITGRFFRNKVKKSKMGNDTFKMITAGIVEVLGAIYISASTKQAFWQGFANGVGASGLGTIATASGVPGIGAIMRGDFSEGIGTIREVARAKMGNLTAVKRLPTPSDAQAKIKRVQKSKRRRAI